MKKFRASIRETILAELAPWALVVSVFGILVWLGMEAIKAKRAIALIHTPGDIKATEQALATIGHFMGVVSLGIFLLGLFFFLLIIHQFILKGRYDKIIKVLRQGHTRYKFLAEGPLSIGIVRLDCRTGKVIDANTGALRLFGLSRGEFIGKRLVGFLADGSVDQMERALKKLVEGKKFFEVSCTIATSLGEARDIDFHLAVPVNELALGGQDASNPREAIAILTDVTERRLAEEERLKNERLRGVLEMAGGAAHELNQPLQVVLGYAAMISMGMEDGHPLKDKVEKLREEAERLSEIGKKIASIGEYAVRDYVGNVKIVDINMASKKVGKTPYRVGSKKGKCV